MSLGHAGDPGPGEITMLSKALFLYTQLYTSLHAHSSLRTTTGGTADADERQDTIQQAAEKVWFLSQSSPGTTLKLLR